MELTKKQKKELKELIKVGINRGCQKWLDETVALIQEPYDGDNAWDRSMQITKRSREYFKETMRREDTLYRNDWLLFSVAALLNEGNLTIEDIQLFGEDITAAVMLIASR